MTSSAPNTVDPDNSARKTRQGVAIAAVLAVVALLAFAAWPWVTLNRIESAIAQRDAERLEEYLDLPALRESVKEELGRSVSREASRRAADDPASALGAAFGAYLIEAVADPVLEALMKPSRLIDLLQGGGGVVGAVEGAGGGGGAGTTEVLSARYESFNRFAVTVRLRSGRTLDVLMRREELGWKAYRVRLPTGAGRPERQ
jgi:hypothetical protein